MTAKAQSILTNGITKTAEGKAKKDDLKHKDPEFWWEEVIPESQAIFFAESKGKTTSIYIIRHGKTKLNTIRGSESKDFIRGWTDVPLDETGEKQAEEIAEFLKNDEITKVYTSDLQRAHRVARELAKERHIPLVTSHLFRPWNLGVFTAKETAKVLPEIAKYITDKPYEPVPEGEAFMTFCDRYIPMLKAIMMDIENGKMGNVALSTHYRCIKATEAWLENVGRGTGNQVNSDVMLQDSMPVGTILKLSWDPMIRKWGYLILKCMTDAPMEDKRES